MRGSQIVPTTLASSMGPILRRIASAIARCFGLQSHRWTMRRLAQLEEWELFDIGLTEPEIVVARRTRQRQNPPRFFEETRSIRHREPRRRLP